MPLDDYARKRDFEVTPEPRDKVKDTGGRRFVVQRHQASHLHFDFRLELDGVLKSWAVPKGPPESTDVRRLAVRVEDHPVDYIDFQGAIPSGYGVGTVEIWDHGDYEMESAAEAKLVVNLHGNRLQGRYALVRTGDSRNWLIMKLQSESAKKRA